MGRAITELHAKLQPIATKFVEECKKQGVPILITSTLRSFAEQNALYAQGRTAPGKVVTNAKGGDSWHNYGLAFDIAFNKQGDIYDGPWEKVGAIGKKLGLTWGGDFKSIKDKPHFEYHPNLTLDQARAQVKAGAIPTKLNI